MRDMVAASCSGAQTVEILLPIRTGKHNRAAQNRIPRRAIGQAFDGSLHGQRDFYAVTITPLAANRGVR